MKKRTKLKAKNEQMRKKKVAHGPITDAPKPCKLFHISVELFSKKITGRKNKKDMRMMNYFWKCSYKTRMLNPVVQTLNYNFYLWNITEICQVEILRPQSARLQHLCFFLSDWSCHVCTLVTWQTSCVCLKHCSPVWNSGT